MSDPTKYFSSVVVNGDDVVSIDRSALSSSAVAIDLEDLRKQLMSYNAVPTKRTNIDELIAALAVCADHGLDLINEKQVALDRTPPGEIELQAIADQVGTSPGVVADVWKLLVSRAIGEASR